MEREQIIKHGSISNSINIRVKSLNKSVGRSKGNQVDNLFET